MEKEFILPFATVRVIEGVLTVRAVDKDLSYGHLAKDVIITQYEDGTLKARCRFIPKTYNYGDPFGRMYNNTFTEEELLTKVKHEFIETVMVERKFWNKRKFRRETVVESVTRVKFGWVELEEEEDKEYITRTSNWRLILSS